MSSIHPTASDTAVQSATANIDDSVEANGEISRLKRCLAASQNKLAEATNAKRKKNPTLVTIGRGIRRIVSLFDNLSSIVEEADRRVMELTDEPSEGVLGEVSQEDKNLQRMRDRTWTGYKVLLHLTPQLRKVMEDPEPASLNSFLIQLQEGANGACSDDIRRIKEELATWINLDYKPTLNWQDLGVRANIRNGADGFSLANKYFLTCLYPNGRGDSRRIERNFLRSKLLLKVYCAIFTSPSSANDFAEETEDGPVRKKAKTPKKATKSNVASLLNMDGRVSGRSIAYAAVMLVFNLTNAGQWVESFNGFNFAAFYNFLVDYFEEFRSHISTSRVEALLKWWNAQVFADYAAATAATDESHDLLAAQQDVDY